jgi:UDP-2-acetamido-3-amino-2,3-dideoxy-glucuronate N-acetyltransferase
MRILGFPPRTGKRDPPDRPRTRSNDGSPAPPWKAHSTAIVESAHVGADTQIWAYAHVMKGARIGSRCSVGDHAFIESGAVIGDEVTIKNGVMVWDGVTICDGAFIGPGVLFTNDPAPRSPRYAAALGRYATRAWLVVSLVGQGASIGAGAIICPGVSIGAHAMVGAGAVVTRDVPEHALVRGTPARVAGWVCTCGRHSGRELVGACVHCGWTKAP